MQHLSEDVALDFQQVLLGQHLLNLLHILLPRFLVLQGAKYFKVQFSVQFLLPVIFLDLFLMLFKLFENLQ